VPGVAFELMTLPEASTTDPKLKDRWSISLLMTEKLPVGCEEGSTRGRDCFEPSQSQKRSSSSWLRRSRERLNSCSLGLIALSSDSSASRRSFPGRKLLQIFPAEVIGDEIV
jgi:hypothetical protein